MSLTVQKRNLLEKALDGRVVETVREQQYTDMGAKVAEDVVPSHGLEPWTYALRMRRSTS
jgi:hypothetical protein